MRERSLWIAVCILAIGFMASTAHADVIYSFSGVEGGASVGFQLSTSTYLTAGAFGPSQLSSCTGCSAIFAGPLLTLISPQSGLGLFLFSSTFSGPGTYTTSWLSANRGTMVVSVPEPTTLLLGLLSIATILGLVVFRNSLPQFSRC
jgi:hypothetical protein